MSYFKKLWDDSDKYYNDAHGKGKDAEALLMPGVTRDDEIFGGYFNFAKGSTTVGIFFYKKDKPFRVEIHKTKHFQERNNVDVSVGNINITNYSLKSAND